jgi:hypothetical protein
MQQLVDDFSEALRVIDQSAEPFKSFQPGVGPYGEPQVVKRVLSILRDRHPDRFKGAKTSREPDFLVPSRWAIEVKIVRPFGDNGREAEHWSQNLLHPYEGNVSAMGDALKLLNARGPERKGLLVLGFEHSPPRIDLGVLVDASELVSRKLLRIPLGPRCVAVLEDLVHPVHQRARVFGWELDGSWAGGPSCA